MTRDSIREGLVERVEAARGPDRELDALIFLALDMPLPREFINQAIALTYDEAEACFTMPIGDMRVRYEPPAFTASIDAAMSLAPNEFNRPPAFTVQRTSNFGCNATVWVNSEFNRYVSGKGKTPALALVAAALRAKVQS